MSQEHLKQKVLRLFNHYPNESWAIAFSGGPDSLALLGVAAELAQAQNIRLLVIHINHQLQEKANQWEYAAAQLCEHLSLPFLGLKVDVQKDSGKGLEAAARRARYEALALGCQQHQIRHLMLAHHQSDQAETILFRLLRGSGGLGVCGMQSLQKRADLWLHRPCLDLSREEMLAIANDYAKLFSWSYVNDPMNTQYARGYIRQFIKPALSKLWPQWERQLARFSVFQTQEQILLRDLAQIDWQTLDVNEFDASFSLLAFQSLSQARQTNVLRYLLNREGALMPSEARLQEWIKQFNKVHQMGTDRRVLLTQNDFRLRVAHRRVYWERVN